VKTTFFLACTIFGAFYLEVLAKTPIFAKKNKIMAVLNFTSREFRSQQAHVFDLADKGEKIIIRRSRKQAYTLVPIEDDDLTITPELQARIDKARAEIKAGKCITLRSSEELNRYLETL
jgi:antitoxin (DNA-binding transcriptional repressor) of toxin-antitoxin stability system